MPYRQDGASYACAATVGVSGAANVAVCQLAYNQHDATEMKRSRTLFDENFAKNSGVDLLHSGIRTGGGFDDGANISGNVSREAA